MKRVVVKNSDIQGNGVFALEDIESGEEILVMDDSHVVKDPKTLTQHQLDFECDFLADGKIILMQSPEVHINHSCDPNTYVKTIDGVRKTFAMNDIKAGEELTYDYSVNGDNEGTFECFCGAKNCRRIYVGDFFRLPVEVQIRYLPYLDSWFVERHQAEIDKLLTM